MQTFRINRIRLAGDIKRFHTARTIKEETVAQHSFNVMSLIMVLTKGYASRDLLLAALMHDLGEAAVGDIPANIKTHMPPEAREELEAKEQAEVDLMFPELVGRIFLTADDEHTLNMADKMDGLLKCTDEVKMGNRHLEMIGERYCDYLMQLTDKNDTYRMDATIMISNFRSICLHGR